MSALPDPACPLCREAGGIVLWADDLCRVVRVTGDEGAAFAGFCRVVWTAHVAELSALSAAERSHLMNVVCALEAALCALLRPDKINLASLGNVVPHLHWHVIPRWRDDSHFPAPVWAAAVRVTTPREPPPDAALRDALRDRLGASVAH